MEYHAKIDEVVFVLRCKSYRRNSLENLNIATYGLRSDELITVKFARRLR